MLVSIWVSERPLEIGSRLFKRKRSGIPATPTDIIYPYEAGYSAQTRNLNSDQVSGIDGMVKWNDRIDDFNYFVGVNLTLARQKNIE